MNSKIVVGTVLGNLCAEADGNPDCPGITIYIEQQEESGVVEKQLAVVECTPGMPCEGGNALRLLVWNDSDLDDYTDDFTFIEETPEETPEDIWKKYLNYLRNWSEYHKDVGNYSTSPLSFDIWFNREYGVNVEEPSNSGAEQR
jgi:hypothetical protein